MSTFVLIWDKLLAQASDKLLEMLSDDTTIEDQKEIMGYGITVLLKELSKTVMLFIIMSVLGYGKDFLIVFVILVSLRMFMGGSHSKSTLGCFIHSLSIILLIIMLANNIMIYKVVVCSIWLLLILCIITISPVISTRRASYSVRQKRKFKIMAIIVAIIQLLFMLYGSVRLSNYIVICELVQVVEVIFVTILNYVKKGVKKDENN